MRALLAVLALLIAVPFQAASARDLTIATWNLGWHMDKATVAEWIDACNATYEQDQSTKLWHRSVQPGSQFGWDIDAFAIEGWDAARLPVCNVYGANKGDVGFASIRVTNVAYETRLAKIRDFIATSVKADIIAFQEVSGREAVAAVLPGGEADWGICSFTTFKVQRLAIAYHKALGNEISCATEDSLSLKDIRPVKEQPRPGLTLALDIDGVRVQVLNVHLKSSCVSPLAKNALGGEGKDCMILHDQVARLEVWLDRETAASDKTILIGDFNRNFWHELEDQAPVRKDGSDPKTPLPTGVKVNSMFEEVVDGAPLSSIMTMLKEQCSLNEVGVLLCDWAEMRPLETPETDVLRHRNYLGCRNPVGLDHVLVGPGLVASGEAVHVSIKDLGINRHANKDFPEPTLGIADHCPMIAKVTF